MAEAIARHIATERGLPELRFSSAGTSAWDGAPASDGALLVAMEHGLDLNGHRARVLTSELVHDADLVLVMGPHHLERAVTLGGDGRTHLLTAYATRAQSSAPVADPFGGDLEAYRRTFAELEAAIVDVIERVALERDNRHP